MPQPPALNSAAAPMRRARLEPVLRKGLAVFSFVLAVLLATGVLGSAAGTSEPSDSVAQAEQPESDAIPSPSDSDDEIRLAMALLIAVAAVALLGTFVYWVRTGDGPRKGQDETPGSAEAGDTLR